MPTPHKELATLAGGCYWCIEAVFQRVPGVVSVRPPAISAATVDQPTYRQVCQGNTGHAEAVEITFDPARVSYAKLLDVFWQAHDPTHLNRQGHDVGTQYRSAIFYHSDAQKDAAEKSIQQPGGIRSPGSHCDPGDSRHHVLPGPGLAPGLLQPQQKHAVLPGRDSAQAGKDRAGTVGRARAGLRRID
jgi:methionine-S-sulfoxide reductase